MVFRGPLATLFLVVTVSVFSFAQTSSVPQIAALQGKVISADGQPLSGIHVEIDDASTAIPVTSTYTQQDGTFELYNIPQGNYEVIAESSDSEVSDPVSFSSPRPSLDLKLRATNSAPNLLDATTSVARMLVPARAQKLYDRALKNFNAGNVDDAEQQLDAALQIDNDYADALTLKGVIEVAKPDVAAGRHYLEHAICVDPSETAAYIALAAVYNHDGRFDDAMRASEKGLSLAPRMWQAYLEMAKASIAKSMYQRGLKFLRQAERLGGSAYGEVHLVKAYALVPLKLYKDAKYELQACVARDHRGQVAEQARQMLATLNSLQTEKTVTQP
jgi:tetratricopeptide (TPR) repeat protein